MFPQRYEDLTYTQKADLFNRLLGLPALTLLSWGRGDVGYRLLAGGGPALMFLLSVGIAAFSPASSRPGALALYALLSAVSGACQRFQRRRDLKNGIPRHSGYLGSSLFHRPWLPGFLRRERRLERFLDPLFFAGVGLAFGYFSLALGGWVLFSAFSLMVLEGTAREDEFKRRMDLVDGVINSEFHGEVVGTFTEIPDTSASRSRQDAGVPTGVADDIRQKIAQRRQRRDRR